jgi:hypothetical protein
MAFLNEKPKFFLPKDSEKDKTSCDPKPGKYLTLLVFGDEGMYAYPSDKIGEGKLYSFESIRGLIREKLKDEAMQIVIKPTKDASYKNTVDILDEMTIDSVKHYALVDICPDEEAYLRDHVLKNNMVPVRNQNPY